MPLKLFDYIQVEEKLKTKIEFIDFPGLNTGFQIAKNNFKDILSFTNGFIFIQGDKVTNENDNKTLLTDILDTISDRPCNFSFKSCIFLMNKCDLYNIDLKKKKSQFEHFIYTIINQNELSKRLENGDKEITSRKQINLIKFSCYNFELFKKENEHINNTSSFFNEYFSNEKFNTKNTEKNLKSILNELENGFFEERIRKNNVENYIKNNIDEKQFSEYSNFLKSKIKNFSLEDSSKIDNLIMTICKYYFYIKKNITLLPLYKNSNVKDFF